MNKHRSSVALIIGWILTAACSSGLPAEKAKPGKDAGSSGDDSGGSAGSSGGSTSGGRGGTGGAAGGGTSSGGVSSGGAAGKAGGTGGASGSAGSSAASNDAKITWNTAVVVDPDEGSEQPDLAMDADGNAWALWNEVGDEYTSVGEIHARHYDAAKDAWDEDAILLDDQKTAEHYVTLAGSANGNAVAAWAKAAKNDAESLGIRAAYYSADDGAWSEVEDLATIARKDLGGIRIAVGSEGTAVVSWSDVFIDNVVDDAGVIQMSRAHGQLVTAWFDGKWHAPETAVDVLLPQSGIVSEDSVVSDLLPSDRFDLTLEDEQHARAIVAWTDGIRAVGAEDGKWSKPSILTDSAGGSVRIVRLSSGDLLAAFTADGSLYASESAAGDASFSEPELLEHSIDSVGWVDLAAAPEAAPIEAALTWNTGDPYNFGSTLVAVRHRDGSWSDPAEVYRTFTGFPQIGVTDAGRVLVGGGKDYLWAAASPDGESWQSMGTSISASANRPIRFAVSPSGFAMFLWADSGSSEMEISHHLLALVGR